MNTRLTAFVLWLLVVTLPVNALAARFTCCHALTVPAVTQGHCPMHRAQSTPNHADEGHPHGGAHCRHCAACCTALPMMPLTSYSPPIVDGPSLPEPTPRLPFSSLTGERLERPPKHFS